MDLSYRDVGHIIAGGRLEKPLRSSIRPAIPPNKTRRRSAASQLADRACPSARGGRRLVALALHHDLV
ncbi:MAG: hypothetical protein ACK463_43980, partial [Bradyrhizobium sp.]